MASENKQLVAFESEKLVEGEKLIAWTPAYRDKKGLQGVLILTDRRIAFFRKGALSEKFEPWPIAKISSVDTRKGLQTYEIKLHTSGDDLELLIPDKLKGEEFTAALQRKLTELTSGSPPSPNSVGSDPLEQLRKLGELRQAGVVSEEEFATKKAELLAKL